MGHANIKGGIEKAKYDLNELLSSGNFLLELKESKILTELELKLDPHNEKILKSLKQAKTTAQGSNFRSQNSYSQAQSSHSQGNHSQSSHTYRTHN